MEVIGIIGYLLACLIVGVILTICVGMFRPIQKTDEFKPWKLIITFFITLTILPYGWAEVMTRWKGADMKKSVAAVLTEAEVKGDLVYYKVLYTAGDSAKVIAVGSEASGWSASQEHIVFAIDMSKGEKGWHAKEYSIVNSFKRGKDGTTIPPYW